MDYGGLPGIDFRQNDAMVIRRKRGSAGNLRYRPAKFKREALDWVFRADLEHGFITFGTRDNRPRKPIPSLPEACKMEHVAFADVLGQLPQQIPLGGSLLR